MVKLIHRLTACSALFFSLAFVERSVAASSTELSGVVVDSKTKQPIPSAHVYVVVGEEEALTGKDGKFKITTWKTLPLSVTATHQDYQKKAIRITNAATAIRIELVKN